MSAAKASATSLEEKLNAMQQHIVQENVEKWAETHGAEIPEHFQVKAQHDEAQAAMYISGAEKAQLSAAVFQLHACKPDMVNSPERQLLRRWLDGIGPMREMRAYPDEARDGCIGRMSTRVAQQGEEIVVKGEPNASIWLVVSGTAELMVPARTSRLVDSKAEKKHMEKVLVKLVSVRNVPTAAVR